MRYPQLAMTPMPKQKPMNNSPMNNNLVLTWPLSLNIPLAVWIGLLSLLLSLMYTPPAHAALGAPTLHTYSQVSAGSVHTCAIRMDNQEIDCWGANDNGEANDQTGTYGAISAGSNHTCAIRTNGRIHCWGKVLPGTPNTNNWKHIYSAFDLSCAINTDNQLRCWGDAFEISSFGIPTTPTGTYKAFSVIPGSGSHACAIPH